MKKYRKKPVEVEARQFLQDNSRELAKWCGGKVSEQYRPHGIYIIIPTMEGDMTASVGDWIIRGVQGEFYPCKPDIFELTYEEVK